MIQFEDVHKTFGQQPVLRGLSFEAHNNEITGLVGPNGSGKTTAFKILAGVEQATSGKALIDNDTAAQTLDTPGRHFSMFLGGATIPSYLTASSYLSYICDVTGVPRDHIAPTLDQVGLTGISTKKVSQYSMGMKQRLGIAGAFLGSPKNVVLDEPANGLDVDGIRWIRNYLKRAATSGTTVLLSSHILSELEMVADKVVFLANGINRKDGTVADLLRSDTDSHFVATPDPASVAQLLRSNETDTTVREDGVEVRGRPINQVAAILGGSNLPFTSLGPITMSMEDVYLDETGGNRP